MPKQKLNHIEWFLCATVCRELDDILDIEEGKIGKRIVIVLSLFQNGHQHCRIVVETYMNTPCCDSSFSFSQVTRKTRGILDKKNANAAGLGVVFVLRISGISQVYALYSYLKGIWGCLNFKKRESFPSRARISCQLL